MTTFAPPKALKLIASGKLTFEVRVVVHRVESGNRSTALGRARGVKGRCPNPSSLNTETLNADSGRV